MRNAIIFIPLALNPLMYGRKWEIEGDVDVKAQKLLNQADLASHSAAVTKA
jgi:hypothetical protein